MPHRLFLAENDMTAAGRTGYDDQSLEIVVGSCGVPVSSLSVLLRVVQAALREVARNEDGTRELMSQRPQPVLRLAVRSEQGDMVLRFAFADPLDSTPLPELSAPAFEAFLEQLERLIKRLPQRGLWGESVGGSRGRTFDSDVARRLDQVRLELRRFPRARLSFGRRTIAFEGDRMEIG